MVDDSTALAEAKLVRTVALLLATPPEPRREILAMMAEPVLAGATKAKYHALIDQYSPLVPAMMERARALVGRHRTEAVTATMFEVISVEERTRWDRGGGRGLPITPL